MIRPKAQDDRVLGSLHPWIRKSWRAMSWNKVVVMDPCPWCGRSSTTRDHVVPSADPDRSCKRGDTPYTVGACRQCNKDKDSRTVLEFLTVRAAAFLWRIRAPWVVRVGRRWTKVQERI